MISLPFVLLYTGLSSIPNGIGRFEYWVGALPGAREVNTWRRRASGFLEGSKTTRPKSLAALCMARGFLAGFLASSLWR